MIHTKYIIHIYKVGCLWKLITHPLLALLMACMLPEHWCKLSKLNSCIRGMILRAVKCLKTQEKVTATLEKDWNTELGEGPAIDQRRE